MKVLILGSGGLLGQALQQAFEDADLLAWTHRDCDITEPAIRGRICEAKPDVVINAAAWTDVDGAEDPNLWPLAQKVNSDGVANLLHSCESAGARLVHISTNEVFAGEPNMLYAEFDRVNPVNAYGRSKAAGEKRLKSHLDRHMLIRVSWLFGPGGDHFPAKIASAADRQATLRVVNDEIGCPTYTIDAARRIFQLVSRRVTGIFHVTNEGTVSRYEWACQILQATGRNATLVHPINSSEWQREAPTPCHAVLIDNRMKSLGFEPMPHWLDALKRHRALGEPWASPDQQ